MENISTVSKKLYDATGKQVCSQTKRNSKSYRIKRLNQKAVSLNHVRNLTPRYGSVNLGGWQIIISI